MTITDFDAALDRYGNAMYVLGELPMERAVTRDGHEIAQEVKDARAAVVALAPARVTITDELVERATRLAAWPIKVQMAFGGYYEATIALSKGMRAALEAALDGGEPEDAGAGDA